VDRNTVAAFSAIAAVKVSSRSLGINKVFRLFVLLLDAFKKIRYKIKQKCFLKVSNI
jgi:hypothetical protein